jgi:hypothetical protein
MPLDRTICRLANTREKRKEKKKVKGSLSLDFKICPFPAARKREDTMRRFTGSVLVMEYENEDEINSIAT